MDFDKLLTFYHVATLGSIAKTVEVLKMDKSSISRHLTILEEQIGCKFFDRVGNQLILTSQGHFLLEKAKVILLEVEATKMSLLSQDNPLTGSLIINSTFALASTWLTWIIHPFVEQNPSLSIRIKASNQPANLSLREADVALRPYMNDHDDLIQHHLCSWQIYLHASKDYVKRFGEPKTLSDLDRHRLIIFGESANAYPYNYANWPLHIGTKNGWVRKPFLLINSVEGMFNLVLNGLGIGCISENSPLLKQHESDLVPILYKEAKQTIDAYFVYHQQFKSVKAIQALEKFLMDYVRSQKLQ